MIRRRRRWRVAAVAAVAAGLALGGASVGPWGSAGAAPGGDGEPDGRGPFSARVQVAWVDHAGQHSAVLDVIAVDGVVRIEGPADLPARPGAATVLHTKGWSLLGPAGGDRIGDDLAGKYDVARAPGPPVADRATTLVSLHHRGELRERLAVDTATGLVLRREQFDPTGRPVRVVTVLKLDTAPPAGVVEGVRPPQGGRDAVDVEELPSTYRAPAVLAGAFRQVGAYRHARGVHLLYTDGLHGLSLFTEPGKLARDSLPRGGEVVRLGRATGVRYTWPGGEVVTWESGPMVHTLVGDATAAELLAAARSLPRPGRGSVLARLRGTCRMVAELVTGGR